MEWITQLWTELVFMFGGQVWLLLLLTILTATTIIDVVQRYVLRIVHYRLLITEHVWVDSFVDAARAPISFFIWVTGLILALTTTIGQFQIYVELIPYILAFKQTILTLSVGWFVIRLVQRLEFHLKDLAREDERLDEVTVEAFAKIIKLLAFVLTGLFFLSAFGVSLTGLLAFGGVGGIAIGFAAKDLLGNVFGGMMLYMDKPFTVGEWIRSPDKDIEGIVEKIGWRMTTVRRFDKRPLYIPNGIFSNIAIENPSRMSHRRIYETVGIRYEDASRMSAIVNDVRHLLENHEEIDIEQTIIVNFNQFSSSSLDFFVYAYTRTTNWIRYHNVKQDVLLSINEIIESHGAQIAFPTRTLHWAKDEGEVDAKIEQQLAEMNQAK
ncbi:mechanosensitive ion channel family protein [Thiomicrorhabdus sediminis]|uniref:Mechanosensitive ion channel family protein n=1 Tax=Thiomicrorhabdus sediminis TaxID=2580412 RepID=A0A4P9K794_9GAMM|nr:mechanosensitive ion channel family protein [Thiomicrorhabdus sediminis]QCU90206.1 mechanosensitive ion channel family protein [Thiomicrorhabdus sediminis]